MYFTATNKHFLKHFGSMFLSFSVFLSISYSKNFVFNSSFYLRNTNSVTYITHIEILIIWASVPVFIDVLNTYME